MKKEIQVVMLPTEKAKSDISKGNKTGFLVYHEFFRGTEGIYTNHTYQHLYFLSDEEIKDGDWFLAFIERKWVLRQCLRLSSGYIITTEHSQINSLDCKKIIATTDPELGLPRPSNEFLKKYCELGGIDKVLVEYDKIQTGDKCSGCGDSHPMNIYSDSGHGCKYCGCFDLSPLYKLQLKVAPDNTISIYPINS